ncbi:MAG: hypothetical protein HDT23_05940 [Ruminococcus sp.]|nr:hypothetical protein [Ruminococcus sp.]
MNLNEYEELKKRSEELAFYGQQIIGMCQDDYNESSEEKKQLEKKSEFLKKFITEAQNL